MKVSFINPPIYKGTRNIEKVFGCTYTIYPFPNIYILTYAALLKREGFEVEYLDAANDGTTEKQFYNWLFRDNAKIYVMYSVFLSMDVDLLTLEHIRRIKGDVPVIFIGPGPTNYPEKFLKGENTFVARGEVDLTLVALATSLRDSNRIIPSDINGISYRNNGSVINNPPAGVIKNLDDLPFPDRSLVRKDLYFNPKLPRKPFTAMITSRQCPYRCVYCVPNSIGYAREMEGRKYNNFKKPEVRARTPESVIKEFRLLEKQGYRGVSIVDDLFTFDTKRAVEICKGIKGIRLRWGMLARADNITDELARSLKEANCDYVDMGVESFNQKTLDFVKKDMNVESIYEAMRHLKRHGLFVKLNILLGANPYETKEEIEHTLSEVKRVKADAAMFSIMTPFPGTELYQMARNGNWFINGDYNPVSVQHHSITSYETLSTDEMERLIKRANLTFYLRPSILVKTLRRTTTMRNFAETIKALLRKLF